MSAVDGRRGRPARRHAHTCRVCDATFGCKAELLEHEQERHIQGQNKTPRRKSGKTSANEMSSQILADSTEKKRPPVGILVGDIAVDHEEIYDGRGGTYGSKKDINTMRKQPNTEQLSTTVKNPVAVTGLKTSGQEIVIKNKHPEELPLPTSVRGSCNVPIKKISLPEDGSGPATVKEEAGKSEGSNHVSEITCPDCSGTAEIVSREEVIHTNDLAIGSESSQHSKPPPSLDVMTVLGLKRRKIDVENKQVSENSAIEKNKILSGVNQGKPVSKSTSKFKIAKPSCVETNQSQIDPPQLKRSHGSGNTSRSAPIVPIETESASEFENESIKEFGSTSNSCVVIETLPASDMFIDSAECSHEVTVIETPSNKALKRKALATPPKCVVASLLNPGNNLPAVNAKRHPTATPNPRMVSVLLLNRDNKTVSSPVCDSKSGVAEGECVPSKASIEEDIRDAVRRLDTAASLVEINSSSREFRPIPVSTALPTSKNCVALTILPKPMSVIDSPGKSSVVLPTSNIPVDKSLQNSKENEESVSTFDTPELLSSMATKIATSPVNNVHKLADDDELREQDITGKESAVEPDCIGVGTIMSTEEDMAHKCKFCNKGYGTFEELESHLMSDHVCKQCGKEFRQVANLRKHIRVSHENVRPHQCPVCGKGFAFASNLSAHFPVHFQCEDGNEKQFTCMYCERTFKHSASMRKHIKEEHVEGSKPHVCLQCNKSFVFKCALDCHMRKHSGFRPFTCATCGTGFKHLSNLQKHVKVLHPGPCPECLDESQQCEHVQAARAALKAKFTCGECNRSYDSAASLTVHVRSHTGEKPETCTICNRSFQHRSNLQKHMMKHAGRKPHACTLCPRAFYARHNLIAHMRKHTGNSPHECKTCGKRFCTKNSLQVHMNLHANVRPFACDVCGRQFSQLGNLQKHMSVHTGERPHVCGECKRSFTDMSALKRHHAAIHERDARYACEVCDKRFLHLSSVRSHRLLHTGVKPHKCETCGKAFTHKSGWLRHVRLHERSSSGVISAIVGKDKEVVLKPGEYIVYLTE